MRYDLLMTMKRRTLAFADTLLADPSKSNTQAYLETHETTNRKAASVEANKILKKPEVQIYMQRHVSKAKQRMVDLLEAKDDVALRAAQDILDRTYGKATIKQESQSLNLNLNVEGSAQLAADFEAYMKSSTTQKQ